LYRLPNGHEFGKIDAIIPYLEANPDLLSETAGFSIELTVPVHIPMAETVVNVGRDRQ